MRFLFMSKVGFRNNILYDMELCDLEVSLKQIPKLLGFMPPATKNPLRSSPTNPTFIVKLVWIYILFTEPGKTSLMRIQGKIFFQVLPLCLAVLLLSNECVCTLYVCEITVNLIHRFTLQVCC